MKKKLIAFGAWMVLALPFIAVVVVFGYMIAVSV